MGRIHWLTVSGIAAAGVVLTVLFHEAVHALACVLVGGEVKRFSFVHVNCPCEADWQFRIVAASASIANLLTGFCVLHLLRRMEAAGGLKLFLWLVGTMNLLVGTGYLFASGLTGTGDWAAVVRGWEPGGPIRVGLIVLGAAGLMGAVAMSLAAFGRLVDAEQEKPVGRAQTLGMVVYATAFVVMFVTGSFQPGGPFAFPGVAGLVAALGGMSPFLWMMQWFRAEMFVTRGFRPLEVEASGRWGIAGAGAVVLAIALTVIGQAG